ncbi:DUF4139 domain-containing protein [bacterium]|nr:DUF4139 domain-containing protein [bacterium]
MRRNHLFVLPVLALLLGSNLFAVEQEELVKAPVVSLEFFKSGLTIVRRQVTPPEGDKPLYFSGDINPAYGTFWIMGDEKISIAAKLEDVRTNRNESLDYLPYSERFKGEKGRVWFTSDMPDLDSALKWIGSEEGAEQFLYLPEQKEARGAKTYSVTGVIEGNVGNDLLVRLPNKSAVKIPTASITMVSGKEKERPQYLKTKLWQVMGATKPFEFEYLTDGMAWAASYRLELDRDGKAYLSMAADVRNHLEKVENADITLVAGQPNVEFMATPSLLDLKVSVQGFFLGLNGGGETDSAKDLRKKVFFSSRNNIYELPAHFGKRKESAPAAGAMARETAVADEEDMEVVEDMPMQVSEGFASTDKEQGSDVSYVSVGKHSMDKDSTTHIPVGTSEVEIERKAEWKIEARRYNNGRLVPSLEESGVQNLWDILSFKNPFAFPMTAGAMEVTEGGHIYSQSMRKWVNPGQKVTMNLTKALSLTAKIEEEVDKKAKVSKRRKKVNGENVEGYEKKINGKLTINNYRGSDAKLKIFLNVCGDFDKFPIPEDKLVSSKDNEGEMNAERERVWEMEIPAKGEATFEYTYRVFELK